MCTVFVLRRCLRGFPVVVVANRDEMFERSWKVPQVSNLDPTIFAPLDARSGGTWIGVNRAGLGAAITNRVHFEVDPSRPSRGHLCVQALQQPSMERGLEVVQREAVAACPNAFNLVIANSEGARVLTYGGGKFRCRTLDEGAHVVTSTHDLNPMMLLDLRVRFEEIAAAAAGDFLRFRESAQEVMADHRCYPERYAVCKHGEHYGTRSATVMAFAHGGAAQFSFSEGPPCTHVLRELPLPWT